MKTSWQERQPVTRSGAPARAGTAIAALCFLVPFLAGFSYILNHFHVKGGYLHDTGWFAALIWHPQEFNLANPVVLDNDLFYNTHLSPILYAIGRLSFFWPFGPVTWFACFQGAILGGSGLLASLALRRMPYLAQRPLWLVVLAMAYAFSGLAMAILSYPHIEALGTLMACAAIAAFFSDRRLVAVMFLLLALSVREDMGFHIVAPLGLLWLWTLWSRRRLTAGGDILAFLLLAFGLSLTAVLARSALYPADDAFTRIYTGTPPYAHLTWAVVKERLVILFTLRLYLVLPAAVALLAAIAWRNPVPLIGFLAYIPWFALNFTAFSGAAGEMAIYYPFPFQIAIFWFLWWTGTLARETVAAEKPPGRLLVPVFLAAGLMIGVPLKDLGDRWERTLGDLLPAWDTATIAATERAAESIAQNRDLLGRIKADPAMLSLRPRAFLWEDNIENPDSGDGPPETLIWHANSIRMPETRQRLAAFGADALYRITGTPFYLASHLPRQRLESAGLVLRPVLDTNLLPLMETRHGQVNASILDLAGAGGAQKLYGPGMMLPPGAYRVEMDARIFDEQAGEAVVDVFNTATGPIVYAPLQRGPGESTATTSLEFMVDPADQGNWEFRISGGNLRGIRITGVRLHASASARKP